MGKGADFFPLRVALSTGLFAFSLFIPKIVRKIGGGYDLSAQKGKGAVCLLKIVRIDVFKDFDRCPGPERSQLNCRHLEAVHLSMGEFDREVDRGG